MKKWSYAAAMLLIASSGCVFTGCIDNDEPYGIQQIRLATASLLEAKKAAVEADKASQAAQDQINILTQETEKLKQEAEKLRAEGEKAYNEAVAAGELAKAEKIRQETEMYIKQCQAQLDYTIADNEIKLKDAQRKYDEAIYWFEKTKLDNIANNANTNALWGLVEAAFGKYLTALDTRNADLKKLLEAQRKLSELELDLIWVPEDKNDPSKGGSFQTPAYSQEAGLKNLKAELDADIEKYQNAIDIWTEFNDKLANSEISQLLNGADGYQAKYDAAIEALAVAETAQKAAELDPANAAIVEEPARIQGLIDEINNTKVAVPDWEYVAEGNPLAVLGGIFAQDKVIVAKYQEFTLNDGSYNTYVTAYENAIKEYKKASLDDNDKAWTTAHIAELRRSIPAAAKEVTAAWANALKVYNNGKDADADAAPNAAEVEKATTAYNNAASAAIPAKDAFVAAEAVSNEALGALNEAALYLVRQDDPSTPNPDFKSIQDKLNDYTYALEQADKNYDAAVVQAEKDKDLALANLEITQRNLNAQQVTTYEAVLAAEAAAREANSALTGDALKAAIDADPTVVSARAAYKLVQDQIKAIPDQRDAILAQYDEDIDTAENAKDADITAAEDAWKEAQINFSSVEDKTWLAAKDAYDKAQADLVAPQEAWDKAKADLQEKMDAYNEAVQAQVDAINELLPALTFSFTGVPSLVLPTQATDELPEAVIPFNVEDKGVYVNAKNYLFESSKATFGDLDDYDDKQWGYTGDPATGYYGWIRDDYDPDHAFMVDSALLENPDLADPTKVLDIFNGYLDQSAVYPAAYAQFGAYSAVLGDLYYLNIGTQLMENPKLAEDIEKLVETGEGYLKQIQGEYNKLMADREEKAYELKQANEAKAALLEKYKVAVGKALNEKDIYKSIVDALEGSLTDLEEQYNKEAKDLLGDMAEESLKNLNAKLAGAQIELAEVEDKLGKYEEYAALPNPYKPYVEYLESVVNKDNEELDFWQKRYTELEAQYKDIQEKQAAL